MLLYSYINLRLLKKCEEPLNEFLNTAVRHRDEEELEALYDVEMNVIDLEE